MQENKNTKDSAPIFEDNSETVFKAIEIIHDFLDDFFSDEQEVLRFNINFLENNGFEYQIKIDYMQLNRFISSAYNTILANDSQVIDNLINKFYKDIINLNKFYKSFLEKTKDPFSIYKFNFLKTNQGLVGIAKKLLENDKNKDKKLANISLDNLNELGDFLKAQFESEFLKEFDEYDESLRIIINTKTYYFDSLLWKEARKSQSIQEFFKKSKRSDTKLEEELSTKLFINEYLKKVDMAQTKNQKWHEYLQEILKVMD
ncbi:hypothetical protein ACKGJI_02510 [Sulfurospirillum sp. 1307]|jgi:hypothetical protein